MSQPSSPRRPLWFFGLWLGGVLDRRRGQPGGSGLAEIGGLSSPGEVSEGRRAAALF